MNKYAIFSGFFGIVIGMIVVYGFLGGVPATNSEGGLGLNYKATVCTYKTPWLGDHYGERELIGCSHNQLYTYGQNLTRDALGRGGTVGPVINITLCNSTANGCCGTPNVAATENFTKYTNCGMDGGTGGTYASFDGYNGNWTVFKTFISSCDNVMINATRLSNHSGTVFAGNTFALVTLQTNDQLTVNWTISIS